MTNHQSKPNHKLTMKQQQLLIIFTLLVGSVLCVPNQQQQQHSGQEQQQQQQRASAVASAADYDKQFLRKALEEGSGGNSARASTDSSNATSASNSFQCPEQFGYYTDTRDCTKYYVCVFGEVLHESCTGGLRFSRELQTCDWPRNVECPQQQQQQQPQQVNASAQSPTGATSATGGPASTFATTVPSITTSASASGSGSTSFKQQQQPLGASSAAKELPASGGGGNEDEEEEENSASSSNNSDSSSGNNNSDADQQDQALKGGSSMVFADEGSDPQQPSFDEAVSPVITSDGAIHLHDGSGGTFSLTPNHRPNLQPQEPQDGPSVDVFVKPLSTQQAPSSGGGGGGGANNRLRGQQSTGASNQGRQQAAKAVLQVAKLQAASLPDQRSGHQHRATQAGGQRDGLPQTTAQAGFHSFSGNGNGDKASGESSEQPDEAGGGDGLSDSNDESPPNDSVGAQADQESNENQDSETLANNEDDSSGGGGGGQQAPQPSNGYIPPVMAPNTLRQSAPSVVAGGGRQLSQLLSVNNRQVESSRSSFKPILFSSPNPVPKKAQSQQANSNNININQQQAGQDARLALANNQRQQQFSNSVRQNQTQIQTHHENQDTQHQHQHLQINQNQNHNNNPHNHHHHQQQQQQQHLHHNTLPAANQNNRQSRMSQQFSNNLVESRQNRLLPSFSADQTMSNNVNFNDSSKLIRLQASQFEPPPTVDSSQGSQGNSFQQFPSQGSRSQNILFSQPAFGFTGDTNGATGAANHHHHSNNNVPDQPGTHLHFEGSGGRASVSSHHHNYEGLANQQQQQQQSSSSASNSAQLLQQQRRPRPPKRQQIPLGSASTGANRRPSVSANQLRPTQTGQPMEFDAPTTTTMTTTSQPTTTNGFLLTTNEGATFIESEETTGPPPAPPTTLRQAAFQATTTATTAPGRPIVVPTTVNFQKETLTSGFNPIQPPATTATFATTFAPPTPLTTVGGGDSRRFASSSVGLNGEPGLVGANRGFHSVAVAGSQGQQHQLRGAQLVASSLAATSPAPPDQTPSSLPAATHVTSGLPDSNSNANANVNANANANANANKASTSNHEQDQQLAANRYLNSAIDALEAGQPFGTVDYDFDILNDNSTERRNPTAANSANSAASASLQPQSNNSSSSSSAHSNLNANTRQRQAPFNGQDEGENISLTNGHPNGGQIGLSLRPQQQGQGSAQTASNGRAKVTANGSQQQVGRQREPQLSASVGGQFNQDSSNSGQQTGALAPNDQQQQQSSQPTKKPRPTNRKITVNHEQAIANNRASTEPAKRPEALFATPTALQTATKCDNRVCRLPDCKCGDTLTPGGLDPKVIPQVILLTFDDAVNDLNWEIYEELFTGRTNPNGCPILATFYVSHEWTDYGQVQTLYSRGHEMASHSVTHSFGEKFSKSQWFKEVNGQREILNMYGGVKMNDVRGMRAPFLQIGGNKMFEMLYDANFTYDSSMPIFENSPPLWPYTLDYQLAHECMITPCPTKSFPGVWEVGMTMWVDLRGGRCSMGDACSNPADEDGVYEMLMKNFNRHYKSNRAPFGLFYHSAWFNTIHHRRGFLRFMGTVNSLSDVFFTTNWQMLQWMRKPTPLDEINSFEPWQCPAKNDRPPPCFHPSVCNVKSEHGTRFMKTCQPCPANQQYPWVGATGFKGKQAAASGSG